MKFLSRKIGIADYEFRDYKFKSKASKDVRRRMIKNLRSKEKIEVQKCIDSVL